MQEQVRAVNLPDEPFGKYPLQISDFLSEHGRKRTFQTGDCLLQAGDRGEAVRFIVSGKASFVLSDDDNRETSVDSLGPGDVFGEISCLIGAPAPSDTRIVADEPCVLIELTAEDFEVMVKENPEFSLTLFRNLARQITRLDKSVQKNKTRRLALQNLISRQEHIFPEQVIGEYINTFTVKRIEELAETDGPVLIIGETGVGKEILAHKLYRHSRRYRSVFLFLDVLRTRTEYTTKFVDLGFPSTIQDSGSEQLKQFLGLEEIGPDGSRLVTPGYFDLTEDGTLLVRGIDQLSVEVQEKLLETVRTGMFTRCGGSSPQRTKLRLIATTELDPAQITPDKQPLLYELLARSVNVPPLRKRRREIPSLVDYFVNYYCVELRKRIGALPQETMKALVNYSWPGNDMELSTTLKRAILVSEGGVIKPQDIYFDLKRVEGQGKLNLLRLKKFKQALVSPLFPAVFQSAVTPFFFILLMLLFLGPADPMQNPAALFAWAVGWPVLIIGAFVWARFWCSLCPIGTLSKLAKKVIAFEKPFPQFLKNRSDLIIAGAVIFIIWFETATNIRHSPANVGILFMVMLASAVTVAVVFERQSWCRYLCGLGGMISVLSKASFVELRADRNVCISQCTSNECYLGNESIEGCPFGIVAPKLHSNRFCKLCGLCVKSCPHGAINLNLRMPGREIWEMRHTNTGTAFLIIGMVGGLLTEMISKMPIYAHLTQSLPIPDIGKFTLVFVLVLLTVNLISAGSTSVSRRVFGDTFSDNYARYGLALLPVALSGFMAFHIYYLINLGVQLPILLSEHFHFEIFRQMIIRIPPNVTHTIQRFLLVVGMLWSLFIVYKIGRAGEADTRKLFFGILPHALFVIFLTVLLLNAISHFFYAV